MKFLVIGLGSMGNRRIRCLKALLQNDIVGFDVNQDRCDKSAKLHGIETMNSLSNIIVDQITAIIVSTPPDQHSEYVKWAIENKKPVFVEASVLLDDVKEIDKANINNTLIAPSCTLRFHPLIKKITSLIKSGKFGKVTNFSYHSGQYLPDWHPWEKVSDFYVSNRNTGGCREILPFELTWMIDTLGFPNEVKGYFSKTIDCGADIEDTYALCLKYPTFLGTLLVDVAARYAVRNLIINMENGQIQWRWDDAYFKLYDAETQTTQVVEQPVIVAASGYNKNIGEGMYIDEVNAFITAFSKNIKFPNSISDDIKVLEILNAVEDSDGGFDK